MIDQFANNELLRCPWLIMNFRELNMNQANVLPVGRIEEMFEDGGMSSTGTCSTSDILEDD